jgi:light-harvesting complex I chlorophyll a/b binding protein 1
MEAPEWTGEVGATLPLCEPKDGMTRWDPLGFTAGANAANFDKYRAAELKHGRVCMIATVGLVAQHSWKLPYIVTPGGFIDLGSVPSGFGAISTAPASYAFGLLVLMAGFLELGVLSDKGRSPGDFGDPAGWKAGVTYTGMSEKLLKTYELEHGRLAMFGVIGTLAAEYLTGNDAVEQWENAVGGGGKLLKYTLYWAQ